MERDLHPPRGGNCVAPLCPCGGAGSDATAGDADMSLREKIHAYRPQKPPRAPVTAAERALVNMKFAVWNEWAKSGKYTDCHRDKEGKATTWHYSAAASSRGAR